MKVSVIGGMIIIDLFLLSQGKTFVNEKIDEVKCLECISLQHWVLTLLNLAPVW